MKFLKWPMTKSYVKNRLKNIVNLSAFQEKWIFSSLLHQKETAATQAALLILPQLAGPWTRGQTPQISSGGSCWMTGSALTSCSSTSRPTSCWQRATACSRQRWDRWRWAWAAWRKTGYLVSMKRWNSLWVASATTAETVPTRTKRCKVVVGPPAAATEPGNQTQTMLSNRLKKKGPVSFLQSGLS